MPSSRTKRKATSPEVWDVFAEAPAGEGRIGAELLKGQISARTISLRGIDVVYIEDSIFENTTLTDVPAEFFPGSGTTPSRYINCDIHFLARNSHLLFGHSVFEACRLFISRAPHIASYDASFIGCKFFGKVACTQFSIDDELRVWRNSALKLEFLRNDLTELTCPDVDFRGGVDLKTNSLRQSEQEIVLLDVIESIEKLKARGLLSDCSTIQSRLVTRLSEWCKRTKQQDLFVPYAIAKKFSPEEFELLQLIGLARAPLS